MDAKTAEALEASIAKWERNAEAETPDDVRVDASACALCCIFYESGCVGCPVRNRSGYSLCARTPWQAAAGSHLRWELHEDDGHRDAFRAAARDEVAFLESLREPVAVEGAA